METHQQVRSVDVQRFLHVKRLLALQGGLLWSFQQSLHIIVHVTKLALVSRHQLPATSITEETFISLQWLQFEIQPMTLSYPFCGSSNPKVYSYLFPGLKSTDPSESGMRGNPLFISDQVRQDRAAIWCGNQYNNAELILGLKTEPLTTEPTKLRC